MRISITISLSIILAIACFAGPAHAANYSNQSIGISIDIDDELVRQPDWRDVISFTTQDKYVSVLIEPVHDLSLIELKRGLSDEGYRTEAVFLDITGRPVDMEIEGGRGVMMTVAGRIGAAPVRGVLGGFAGHDGQGFLVIATASPEKWEAWMPRMKAVFDSIRFVEIDHSGLIAEWEGRIKGKKLEHSSASVTGSAPPAPFLGGATRRDYHLCSDGTVKHKMAAVGQVAGPNVTVYSSSMSESFGEWGITITRGKPYLEIREGRRPEKLKLEYEGEKFLLNGRPYVITENDLCE